jgi:hypothetical protein
MFWRKARQGLSVCLYCGWNCLLAYQRRPQSPWRLSKAHAKIVSEFSTRFREEASWIASKATD